MKRNGDLMMWRPISRKSSSNGSAGNSGTGSSTSNSDSSNGSTNMDSSHKTALSVGSGTITVSRTPSWSQAPELEKSTRGPIIRGSSGSTRSRNGEIQNDPGGYPFVTAKYTNFIRFVLSKNYDTDRDITHAGNDVDSLVAELEQTMSSLTESRIDKRPSQLKMCRDELILVTRQFVSNAKSLVTSATQSSAKLFGNVNCSIHTLAKMFLHCHATLLMMDEVPKALKLGQEMTRVADAYKKTVITARHVMEQPLTDSIIKQLMKQATWLASLLGDLMKILLSVNVDS